MCSPSGSSCFVVHLTCLLVVLCFLALSLFPFRFLFPRTSDAFLHPHLPYRVSTTTSSTTCGILCETCFSSSKLMVFSPPISWNSTWPRSHCLVTLLLIYSVTRKARMILHSPTPEHYSCFAQCNLVTLGTRPPLQPQLWETGP